jgi:hypothetical protein
MSTPLERCLDMLADVPGKNLEMKVTKIVGDYLALQIMLQEARAQVESMRASLNLAYVELKKHEADYHHRTSIAANNAIVDALGQSDTSTVRTSEVKS